MIKRKLKNLGSFSQMKENFGDSNLFGGYQIQATLRLFSVQGFTILLPCEVELRLRLGQDQFSVYFLATWDIPRWCLEELFLLQERVQFFPFLAAIRQFRRLFPQGIFLSSSSSCWCHVFSFQALCCCRVGSSECGYLSRSEESDFLVEPDAMHRVVSLRSFV